AGRIPASARGASRGRCSGAGKSLARSWLPWKAWLLAPVSGPVGSESLADGQIDQPSAVDDAVAEIGRTKDRLGADEQRAAHAQGGERHGIAFKIGVARLQRSAGVDARAEDSKIETGQLPIIDEAGQTNLLAQQFVRVQSREPREPSQRERGAGRDGPFGGPPNLHSGDQSVP